DCKVAAVGGNPRAVNNSAVADYQIVVCHHLAPWKSVRAYARVRIGRPWWSSFLPPQALHVTFNRRALEKIGVQTGPQFDRVDEHKVAKVLSRHEFLLDHLVGFVQHLSHVRHVPVTDVRTVYRLEAGGERIALRVKGRGGDWIVAFAPEVEVRHEE